MIEEWSPYDRYEHRLVREPATPPRLALRAVLCEGTYYDRSRVMGYGPVDRDGKFSIAVTRVFRGTWCIAFQALMPAHREPPRWVEIGYLLGSTRLYVGQVYEGDVLCASGKHYDWVDCGCVAAVYPR